MLPESTLRRLETQLDLVPFLLRGADSETIMARPASGEWSPHEHLAHLARQHAVFLERLQRIIAEDAPELPRYRAEEDSRWSEWSSLATDEVLSRLFSLRSEILQFIANLREVDANRVGIHPVLGKMDIAHWLEFFLLHEAHHLYRLMILVGTQRGHR
jgi:hypothetical protein